MKTFKISHLLLGILVTFVWGLNFVVIRVGLDDFPPIFLGFLRFFFSAFPAIFFLPRPAAPFYKVAAYGFIIFTCQFALLFVGMRYGLSAGLASIVLQMQAFVTIVLSVIIMRERPLKSQLAGAAIAFCGIALIGAQSGSDISIMALMLALAAAVAWGAGNIVARSIGVVNILSLVVWGSLVAILPLGLLSLVLEGGEVIFSALRQMSWFSAGTIFYQSYLSTLFGYAVWSGLLVRYPASSVAPLSLLVPVFGLGCAAFFLGEPLPLWKICAALLVLLGLVVNLSGSFLKRKPSLKNI